MPSPLAFEFLALLLGLLLGSFLNVCISRLPEHRSLVRPRSHCPQCGHLIRWYDNIPLLSWILLRGRCRDCDAMISWRYPAVELATGLWFAAITKQTWRLAATQHNGQAGAGMNFREAGEYFHGFGLALLGFLLLGLLVMDWRTHRLPDAFTLSGTLLGFLLICTEAIFLPYGTGDIKLHPRSSLRLSSPGSFAAKGNVFLTGTESLVFGRLAAIVGVALVLLTIRWLYFGLRGRRRLPRPEPGEVDARYGLGLGDVKLLAMIAAFLGFWPAVLALFLGVLGATTYALPLLARRRAAARTQLPLGSFLALGGLITALFGEPWLDWYRSLL